MLVESTESGRLIGQRAVFRLHFVVFKNDRDRVLTLSINVGRLFHDHEILIVKRSGRAQDRFHLFLRHAICHLIDVCLGDAFAGTGDAEHEQEYERESRHRLQD
jgi:hypothetical protein